MGLTALSMLEGVSKDPMPSRWLTSLVHQNERVGKGALFGGGSHRDRDRAALSAIGEFLERLSAKHTSNELVKVRATFNQMQKKKTVVSSLKSLQWFTDVQFSQKNFPLLPFDENTSVDWVCGESLFDRSEYWAPWELVQFADSAPRQHWFSTSSGLAAHTSRELAEKNALLELVERDAVMRAWWTRLGGSLINEAHFTSPELRDDIRQLASLNLNFQLQELPNDFGARVVIATTHLATVPFFLMGIGCDWDLESACEKAISEWVQGFCYRLKQPERRLMVPEGQWDQQLQSFDDHVLLHATPQPFLMNHFRTAGRAPSSSQRPLSCHEEGLHVLKAKGFDVMSFDLTSPQTAEFGFYVVRVLAPGLIPVNSAHLLRPWGHPRLQGVSLNPTPHPFP